MSAATMLKPAQVAPMLGVSVRKVYELAGDPLPCYRVNGSVRFSPDDVREYLAKCRYTETKRKVAGALNLTAASMASGSVCESAFQKLGIAPKQTHTTGKNRNGSTTSLRASRNLKVVSSTP